MPYPTRNRIPLCHKAGIYIITNKKNGKIYIGSTTNIYARLGSHRSALRKGKHENSHLQYAWKKYGEDNFKFNVIETCEINLLLIREQYWIDDLKASNRQYGYNISIAAGYAMLGRNHSEESKKKMSDKRQGWDTSKATEAAAKVNIGKKRSEETCMKISETHKKLTTPELRAKRKRSAILQNMNMSRGVKQFRGIRMRMIQLGILQATATL